MKEENGGNKDDKKSKADKTAMLYYQDDKDSLDRLDIKKCMAYAKNKLNKIDVEVVIDWAAARSSASEEEPDQPMNTTVDVLYDMQAVLAAKKTQEQVPPGKRAELRRSQARLRGE